MVTFRRMLIALAILALFIGLAKSANAQQLVFTQRDKKMVVPEEMLHQLFKLDDEPRIALATVKEEDVEVKWTEYFFPDKGNSHTFRIFFKPGTEKEWFWYHSFDQVAAVAGKDGKFNIRHEATIWVAKRPFPWIFREQRPKELVTYRGDSIDKSKDKLGEAIKKKLKIELPSSIEM